MSKFSKFLDVIAVLIGGIIAIYAQADQQQNSYILIVGIVLLMFGLMSLSRRIPSKKEVENLIVGQDEEE